MVRSGLGVRNTWGIYRRRNPNKTYFSEYTTSECTFPGSQQNAWRVLDRLPIDVGACHFYPHIIGTGNPRRLGEWEMSQWQTQIS